MSLRVSLVLGAIACIYSSIARADDGKDCEGLFLLRNVSISNENWTKNLAISSLLTRERREYLKKDQHLLALYGDFLADYDLQERQRFFDQLVSQMKLHWNENQASQHLTYNVPPGVAENYMKCLDDKRDALSAVLTELTDQSGAIVIRWNPKIDVPATIKVDFLNEEKYKIGSPQISPDNGRQVILFKRKPGTDVKAIITASPKVGTPTSTLVSAAYVPNYRLVPTWSQQLRGTTLSAPCNNIAGCWFDGTPVIATPEWQLDPKRVVIHPEPKSTQCHYAGYQLDITAKTADRYEWRVFIKTGESNCNVTYEFTPQYFEIRYKLVKEEAASKKIESSGKPPALQID